MILEGWAWHVMYNEHHISMMCGILFGIFIILLSSTYYYNFGFSLSTDHVRLDKYLQSSSIVWYHHTHFHFQITLQGVRPNVVDDTTPDLRACCPWFMSSAALAFKLEFLGSFDEGRCHRSVYTRVSALFLFRKRPSHC